MIRDHALELNRLSERWRNLEFRIKEAEQISGSVIIPAINELRYTGRRLFEAWLIADKAALKDEERTAFHDHILMAVQYFNNADHDLTDGLISFFSERRRHFLQKYGLIRATKMYPVLVSWMGRIEEAQSIILDARTNRHNRMSNYERLEKEFLPTLIGRYKEIILSEISYVRRYKMERFFWFLGVAFTFVAGCAELLNLVSHWKEIIGSLPHLW